LVLVSTGGNSGPIREKIQNWVEQEKEIPELIAGGFDLDCSGVNCHETAGENSASTDREVRTDETECTDFDGNLARSVQRIRDLDQRAKPILFPVERIYLQRAFKSGEFIDCTHFRTTTGNVDSARYRSDVETF